MDPLGTGKLIDLARDLFGPLGTTLGDAWAIAIGGRVHPPGRGRLASQIEGHFDQLVLTADHAVAHHPAGRDGARSALREKSRVLLESFRDGDPF